MTQRSDNAGGVRSVAPEVLRRIAEAIGSLRFGAVEITIHEGEVVQIERREKLRLRPDRDRG